MDKFNIIIFIMIVYIYINTDIENILFNYFKNSNFKKNLMKKSNELFDFFEKKRKKRKDWKQNNKIKDEFNIYHNLSSHQSTTHNLHAENITVQNIFNDKLINKKIKTHDIESKKIESSIINTDDLDAILIKSKDLLSNNLSSNNISSNNFSSNNISSNHINSKNSNFDKITSNEIEAKDISVVSDKRKKKNIIRNPISSDFLDKINMVSFEYKDDNEEHIGFIAQEIEQYYPELIKKDSSGFLSVKYLEMIPLLLDYNQNLKKHVNELEKKINNI
jgi:DNA (cytosine-5)-methyltransferase 1